MHAVFAFSIVQSQFLLMGLVDDRQLSSIVLLLPDNGRVDDSADTVGKNQCVGIAASLAVGHVAGRETGSDNVESHLGTVGSHVGAVNAFIPFSCLVVATSSHQVVGSLSVANGFHQAATGNGGIGGGSLGSMA